MFLPAHLSMPVSSAISWVNLRFELYVVASVSGLGLLDCKFQNVPMYNAQPEKIGINSLDSKAITDNSFSSICEIRALHGIPQCRMGIKKKGSDFLKNSQGLHDLVIRSQIFKAILHLSLFPYASQQPTAAQQFQCSQHLHKLGARNCNGFHLESDFLGDGNKRCSPQKSLGASGLAT